MARKRTIQLPRGYLSYSQMTLWLSNQDKYAKLYFDNRDELRTTNAGQEYGKVVATLLERGEESGDLLTDTAMFLLPKYDLADKEITTCIDTKQGKFDLLIRPDSMDSVTKNFLEYKTGKLPWTQGKAQNHLQLKVYAAGIYNEYKVVPQDIKLIWIETHQENGEIKPTGKIETFQVSYTLKDILETLALISRVAKEIEVSYAMHERNPHIDVF